MLCTCNVVFHVVCGRPASPPVGRRYAHARCIIVLAAVREEVAAEGSFFFYRVLFSSSFTSTETVTLIKDGERAGSGTYE